MHNVSDNNAVSETNTYQIITRPLVLKRPRVLIACERHGKVRDAMESVGCNAYSCDTEPSEGKHLQCDVREVLEDKWDMIIAHPPCTFLSRAANHVWNELGRATKRAEALGLFLVCYYAPCERVVVENPMGWPGEVFRKPDQIIHPYYFGDPVMKRTCLWLRGLPRLKWSAVNTLFEERTATEKPEPIYFRHDGKRIHFTEASHGSDMRSVTFDSIAAAMADQWGRQLVAAINSTNGV